MSMPAICGAFHFTKCSASLMSLILNCGSSKPNARGEQPEDLGIRFGLAAWLNRLFVDGQIEVAPGEHHVVVLSGHGRGQDDVGVSRGVGDEMLGRHEEQVPA